MDTLSYLLGKKSGGGGGGSGLDWSAIGYESTPQDIINGYNYAKQIYDNWQNVSNLISKFSYNDDLLIMPLVDTSNATNMQNTFLMCKRLISVPLLDTSNVTNMQQTFYNCISLKTIPQLNTFNVTNMSNCFTNCSYLESIPLLNTSNVTNMSYMFSYADNLKTIPQLNTSKVTNIYNMFQNVGKKLTDESLDNILKMCININSNYSGIKTLARLGFSSTSYISTDKWQSLPSYQDFINAGWTIGYS